MWGDNTCGDCEHKELNDNGETVNISCNKYKTDLFLYTFIGFYMDSEKCNECINA